MFNKINMLNRYTCIKITCITLLFMCAPMRAQGPELMSELIFDTISLDVPIDLHEEQSMQEIQALARQAACSGIEFFTVAEIIQILTSGDPLTGKPIKLQELLQFDLYHKTYPIMTRGLQSLPSLTLPLPCTDGWIFSVEPFFNMTKRMFFTPHSSRIGSYIALVEDEDFLELIDERDFTTVNIPEVFPLFGQASLEERRLGMLVSSWIRCNRWTGIISLPVYYHERNLFLSEKQQEEIKNKGLFAGEGVLPGLNFDTFTNQHLVSDKIGIGDLRLQAYYNIASENAPFELGFQVTWPTAHVFKRGIIGGTFCKNKPIPLIDFKRMFDLFLCSRDLNDKRARLELSELVVDYGIQTIDRLIANIADASLGSGHITLGPIIHAIHPVAHWLNLELRGEATYSVPDCEIRLFKVKKDPADFNRDYESESQAAENLLFLMTQASNTLYPTAVEIETKPGLIVRGTIALMSNWSNCCTLRMGYDIWHQKKEVLGPIKFRFSQTGALDLAAGTKHGAHEGKIFADLGTSFCMESYDVRVALRGDLTVHNQGIGKSATLGLNVAFHF